MTPTPYRIPLAQPDLGGRETYYVNQALLRGQLTQGAFVERFEHDFAARLGVAHAVACSSGTAALHLALLAAGVQPGDRVLVPTLTYVATVAAVRYCGAIPVFGDADPETWGLDPREVPQSKLHLVIPVHLYGVTCFTTTDEIEDAAEALGATNVAGRPAGTIGRMGVFSFYGNKILTTGEGGMVVTDDAALAAELRLLRGQGQDPARRYWHTRVGFNYRMTEISAAIGCAQLERLDEMLETRETLLQQYRRRLYDVVTWQTARPGTTVAPWVFACLLPDLAEFTDANPRVNFRDFVMGVLGQAGIETRPTFPCVHTMPPYREFARDAIISTDCEGVDGIDGYRTRLFPVAEDIARRGIVLPLHSQMTVAHVDDVCMALRRLL